MGEEIIFDFSRTSNLLTKPQNILSPDFELHCGKTSKGTSVTITSNYGSCTPHMHQLSIYGTKGTFFNHMGTGLYIFNREPEQVFEECKIVCPSAPKYALVNDFVSAIKNKNNNFGLMEAPWQLAETCLWNT